MKKYTIFGVEEVYDEFDDYEHSNALPLFCAYADNVDGAAKEGERLLRMFIEYNQQYSREKFYSTGTFIPNVIQIGDEAGNIVLDNSSSLVRSWPSPRDERGIIPAQLPTRTCFLSYSHRDTDFVLKLSKAVKRYSLLPWFDLERPDMPNGRPESNILLERRIADGIMSASVFLVTISSHSLKSGWVSMEVMTALKKVPIVWGLIVSPMNGPIPPWLVELKERCQILDLMDWEDDLLLHKQLTRIWQDSAM